MRLLSKVLSLCVTAVLAGKLGLAPEALSRAFSSLKPAGVTVRGRIVRLGPAIDDILARHKVQVILCDQCMPLMSGTEFMERVKNLCPDTFRIMLSAYADLTPIMAAIIFGSISG